MNRDELRDWFLSRCRHFNGVINTTCEAGVVYHDVFDLSASGDQRIPCFRQSATPCPLKSFMSEEEAVAAADEMRRRRAEIRGRPDFTGHALTAARTAARYRGQRR